MNISPDTETNMNRNFFNMFIENDPKAVDYRKIFVSIFAVLPIEGEDKLGLAFNIFDCGQSDYLTYTEFIQLF